eukprot:GHVN01018736.1.p1 GENE.GHVN01018736.1~~GHVN01018736.1.p1  ORF type:complete len:409 (-),score=95.24 GHVN01018736.1:26-1252(-)
MCRLTAVLCSEQPILLADIVTRPHLSIIHQSFNSRERHFIDNPRSAYEMNSLNGDGFGIGWYSLPYLGSSGLNGKRTNYHSPYARCCGESETKVSRCVRRRPITQEAHCDDSIEVSRESHFDEPCVFTSLKPAWSDRNLHMLAEKTYSRLLFAHVRAAGPSSGVSTELSCHPFHFGRFLFMHNGCVSGFTAIRRHLLSNLSDEAFNFAVSNSCIDSAVIFALFISHLTRGGLGEYTPDELLALLEITITEVIEAIDYFKSAQEVTLLNIVISDGRHLIASRYAHPPSTTPALTQIIAPPEDSPHSEATPGHPPTSTPLALPHSSTPVQSASLYYATGTQWRRSGVSGVRVSEVGEGGRVRGGEYKMSHKDKRNEIVIITSEPLTEADEEWVPVPHNHIIVVTSLTSLT